MSDEQDWGVLPLAEPGQLSDDPRLKGTLVGIGDDGRGVVRGDPSMAHTGPSMSGPKLGGSAHLADRQFNQADVEAARARTIEANKAHQAALQAEQASHIHPDERQGMMKTMTADGMPRHPQAVRQLSPDELMSQANAMLDAQRAQPQGGSLSPRDASGGIVADANGQKLPDWLVREQENGGGG